MLVTFCGIEKRNYSSHSRHLQDLRDHTAVIKLLEFLIQHIDRNPLQEGQYWIEMANSLALYITYDIRQLESEKDKIKSIGFSQRLIRDFLWRKFKQIYNIDPEMVPNTVKLMKDALIEISHIEDIPLASLKTMIGLDSLEINLNRTRTNFASTIHFTWQADPKSLRLLCKTLHTNYNYIQSPNELEYFLNNTSGNKKIVHWNSGKIRQLAYLIYVLYHQSYIKLNQGKGYFKYAQSCFLDYENNPLSRSLRKISSEVRIPGEANNVIVREIDNILKDCNLS